MTNPVDGICIGILLIFYLCTVIAPRWTPKTTTVTPYDPPFSESLLEMLQFDLACSRSAGVLTGLPDLVPKNEEEFGRNVLQLNIPGLHKHHKAPQ
jgi:hypothetical protein